MKRANLILLILCALGGAEYFTTFSDLAIAPVLKPIVALAPLQIGILIYFLSTGRLLSTRQSRPKSNLVK